jgi:hypothetical protein
MAVAGILSSLDPKHETAVSKLHVDEYSDVLGEEEKKEKWGFWNKTKESKERERTRERENPRDREKADEELTRMIGAS